MTQKIKEIVSLIALISIILLGVFIFSTLRDCAVPKTTVSSEEFLVPTEVYHRPIVKLPFIKEKLPVPKKDLPIPESQVKRTVRIQVPGHRDVILVFDQDDRIFRSKDTPEDVTITDTIWKPRPFSLKPRFGYTLAYSGGIYHCFSLDIIHFNNISLGSEIGVRVQEIKLSEALVGLSAKYRFGSLTLFGVRTDLQITVGWNFMKDKVYGGISCKW